VTRVESDLTVVIPTYNQSQYLEGRINSILKQTIVPSFFIVIDDKSDKPYLGNFDDLVEFKNGEVNLTYIVNKERNGIATKTWLQGVSLVKTKYVWIAEGDDLVEPHFVEHMIERIRILNLDFATCQSFILSDGKTETYRSRHKNLFPNINWKNDFTCSYEFAQQNFLYLGNPIENVGSCIFKTESVLRALNKSRNISNLTCDWEVYLNFLPTDKFGFFSEFLNIFRDHLDSQRSITTLSQMNEQVVDLIKNSVLPNIGELSNVNLLNQVLINLMRNNPLDIYDEVIGSISSSGIEVELKDVFLIINDSSSNYTFQDKLFADNLDLFSNFYSFNYLIDIPLFSEINLKSIQEIVKPRILFIFDIFNLPIVLRNFPTVTCILFFDESDINFEDKLHFVRNLNLAGHLFIVFCGQNIERVDSSFNDSSILQFSRLNHESDQISDFLFLEFLNFINGILLSDLNSRSI
jgi:hypothetical protein